MTSTNGHTAWGYIRVSGDEQADRGLPVAGQRRALAEYAQEHGVYLERVFVDEARSGGSDQREQFQLMMHLVHQSPPPCQQILLWSWSRFARDQDDAHYWKASLRRHGVQLRAIDGETPDAPTGFDYVLEALIHWKDEQKLIEVSQSAKRGQQTLARMGYVPSGARPPRGYRVEFEEREIEGRVRRLRRWVPDPKLWPLVRRAWEMRIAGASYRDIHAETRLYRGSSCYSTFFRNTTYKGTLEFGDTVIPVEPVVTEEEWEMVNAKAKQRRSGAYARRQSSRFLLSGLLTCARCGRALCGHNSHAGVRNDGYYRNHWDCYICLGKRAGTCDLPRIKAENIENAVVAELLDHVLTPTTLETHWARIAHDLEDQQPVWQAQQDALEGQIREADAAVERLLDAIEAGQPPALIGNRLAERQAERERLEAELAALRGRMAPVDDERRQTLLGAHDRLRDMLERGDRQQARAFIAEFVESVEVDADSGIMRYRVPTSTGVCQVPPQGGLSYTRRLSWPRPSSPADTRSPHTRSAVPPSVPAARPTPPAAASASGPSPAPRPSRRPGRPAPRRPAPSADASRRPPTHPVAPVSDRRSS